MSKTGALMLRRFTVIVVVILVAGLAVGLSKVMAQASPSSSPAAGPMLRIGWTTEPDNLNPFIGWQNQDYEIWSMNYDFLFGFGTTSKPTLDLASEYPTVANGGLSADGKVWTIHLRPHVRWSDGQPLTADDVAFTYNYIVKNKMLNMQLSTEGILGATALDPTTVRITCSSPEGRHGEGLRADRPQAHLGQGHAAGRHDKLHQPRSHRRQWALHRRPVEQGVVRADGQESLLLGKTTRAQQHHLRDVPGRRHHDRRPQVRRHRRGLGHPGRPVQQPQERGRTPGTGLSLLQLGVPELQLL